MENNKCMHYLLQKINPIKCQIVHRIILFISLFLPLPYIFSCSGLELPDTQAQRNLK